MKKKQNLQTIISALLSLALIKAIIYFVDKARYKRKFKKDMEEVKQQVFNDPFYKKQREELGL
jgi:hypothetical protein